MSLLDRLHLPPVQRAALEAAYATPPRMYHSIAHVDAVLADVDLVEAGTGWSQPREVRLAAAYHDAIYDAARSDNEARSADLARAHIARWMPGEGLDVDRIAQLIELTARHGRIDAAALAGDPAPQDALHFLDCDMAVLGAPPAVFDAYHRGIAAEYRGHVPGWLFKINRKRFLKALLARERIFMSDFMHTRLDGQARINLRRAITHKQ